MANNSNEALQDIQNFQGSMKSGSDILSAQEQKLGIPQAQSQVSGLRQAITNTTNLLNQIPSSVYGRTAGSLVTSGQAGRQIQNETAPVASKLESQNQDFGQQQADLQQLTGKAQTGAQLDLQDQQTRLGVLQNIYQALFGKEQAESARQMEERRLQEEIRQANMTNARASGGGGLDLGSLLGGAGGAGGTPQDPLKSRATAAVNDLLRQNGTTVQATYNAIKKSAGYGNVYDQLKLQLLNTLRPGLSKPGLQVSPVRNPRLV